MTLATVEVKPITDAAAAVAGRAAVMARPTTVEARMPNVTAVTAMAPSWEKEYPPNMFLISLKKN
ncbi:MAG: hypothetical protein EA357_08960 [Micavibrio sp.]|nr:MAG: hypothetical protein EA357_08960 [Micavibrio sp.]